MTLTQTINSYFSVLIITIFGAAASLLIIHIANADVSAYAMASL